jgi:hypothetical protein
MRCVLTFPDPMITHSDDSYSMGSSNPVLRPSTPSSVSASSRASTPFDDTVPQSTVHRHTISIFPRGSRISVKEHVPGHGTALEPPVPQVDATSVETDRDEDYEDMPYEGGAEAWVDVSPKPEIPPAKRSRTAYKATTVSLISNGRVTHVHMLITFKRKKPHSKLSSRFVTSCS